MRRKPKFVFSGGLQRSVKLLRNCGLIEEKQFPTLLSPIRLITEQRKNEKGKVIQITRFLVKIKVRDSFNPTELWLKFNRRGNSIYVSPDLNECISINAFRFLD